MDYIQSLFSFFNAPLFAIFILGLFWKRMTGTAGWTGLISGTIAAVIVDVLVRTGVIALSSQAGSFVGRERGVRRRRDRGGSSSRWSRSRSPTPSWSGSPGR